jgi:hypothetical protein
MAPDSGEQQHSSMDMGVAIAIGKMGVTLDQVLATVTELNSRVTPLERTLAEHGVKIDRLEHDAQASKLPWPTYLAGVATIGTLILLALQLWPGLPK